MNRADHGGPIMMKFPRGASGMGCWMRSPGLANPFQPRLSRSAPDRPTRHDALYPVSRHGHSARDKLHVDAVTGCIVDVCEASVEGICEPRAIPSSLARLPAILSVAGVASEKHASPRSGVSTP